MKHLGLVALVVAAACGPSISTTNTNPSPRPLTARSVDSVEVYTTKLPARPYVEVAIFRASKGQADQHIDALRERAASYGCDALVFTVMPSQHDYSHSSGKPGEIGTTTSSSAVSSSSATCVVWNEPAPATANAPAPAAPEAVPASAPQ